MFHASALSKWFMLFIIYGQLNLSSNSFVINLVMQPSLPVYANIFLQG